MSYESRTDALSSRPLPTDSELRGLQVSIATGEPLFCTKCAAAFSSFSKAGPSAALGAITEEDGASAQQPAAEGAPAAAGGGAQPDEQEASWACEFCGCNNVFDLEPEEVPTEPSVDYLLSAAPLAKTTSSGSQMVIFAIDVSGSMCVTSEVEGKVRVLKNRLPTPICWVAILIVIPTGRLAGRAQGWRQEHGSLGQP